MRAAAVFEDGDGCVRRSLGSGRSDEIVEVAEHVATVDDASRDWLRQVRDLVEGNADLEAVIGPMLAVRRTIREKYITLHERMMLLAREDSACRLLITAPGVGPFVALTYRASINEPARFRRSRAVGAHVGLAPRTHQSGELDRRGSISKSGDVAVRTALFETAGILLRPRGKPSTLKAWGLQIAKRRGMARAMTAVARKLAVVLHRMWVDETPFRWNALTA